MLDSKELIRIEKKFSSLNLFLAGTLIVYYMIFKWFGRMDLAPAALSFGISVVLLGIDFGLGKFDFFESDFLIKIIKFCELLSFAIFTFYGGGFVLNVFIAGMAYFLISVQVLISYDITEVYSRITATIFNIIPLCISLITGILFKGSTNFYIFIGLVFLSVFVVCEASFLNTFSEVFNILYGKINVLNEMVISNREENDTMKVTQQKIIQVNEQLSLQRFKLQKANERIVRNNKETMLLNLIAKDVTVYLEKDKLMQAFTDNIIKYMQYDVCYMALVDNERESFSHYMAYSEDSRISKVNKNIFEKKYFVMENLNSHSVVYMNNYAHVKMECFRGSRIRSAVIYPVIINDDTSALYIIGSKEEDYFKDGEKFINNLFSQITLAFNNVILYSKMHDMAVKDALTGIYNRQYFNSMYNEFMQQCLKQKRTLTIVLFDIDKFKNINDTYGHVFGDEVIRYCGHMALKYTTGEQTFAVRYGGEEFVMVFPDKSVNYVLDRCQEMHEEIKKNEFEVKGQTIHINISLGIASYPEHCTNPEEQVNLADRAMYYSKEHGRGRITVYTPTFEQE